jgi:UDP-N-acetylmuramate--alanine ligase
VLHTDTEVHYLGDFASIEKFILQNCQKDDVVITMGAGNVNDIAADLLS